MNRLIVLAVLALAVVASAGFYGGSVVPPDCVTGQMLIFNDSTPGVNVIRCADVPGGGGIPAGAILLTLASCPSGFVEDATLNGRAPIGTLTANGNVGTVGGADTISAILSHTHGVAVNDPGHTHLTQRYPTATGALSGFTIDTSMSGTVADNTLPVKAQTTGVTATTANPAGAVASFDNRSAFARVIFCRKL